MALHCDLEEQCSYFSAFSSSVKWGLCWHISYGDSVRPGETHVFYLKFGIHAYLITGDDYVHGDLDNG